jgi:hypothetical protein
MGNLFPEFLFLRSSGIPYSAGIKVSFWLQRGEARKF